MRLRNVHCPKEYTLKNKSWTASCETPRRWLTIEVTYDWDEDTSAGEANKELSVYRYNLSYLNRSVNALGQIS